MMTHRHSKICSELRKARVDRNYTLLDVSNLTGLSISTIVNAERKIPSPRTIKALSECYGIKLKLAQKGVGNIIYL